MGAVLGESAEIHWSLTGLDFSDQYVLYTSIFRPFLIESDTDILLPSYTWVRPLSDFNGWFCAWMKSIYLKHFELKFIVCDQGSHLKMIGFAFTYFSFSFFFRFLSYEWGVFSIFSRNHRCLLNPWSPSTLCEWYSVHDYLISHVLVRSVWMCRFRRWMRGIDSQNRRIMISKLHFFN